MPEHHGVLYIDTPGLADTTLRAEAATEITTAFSLAAGGPCKLFFVMTLRYGRVSPEDVATMNIILRSIISSKIEFAIIVNNVQRQQFAQITNGQAELKAVTASISSGPFSTPYIFFVPELEQLSEQENALIELPSEFMRIFHTQTPTFMLQSTMVQPVAADNNNFQSLVEPHRN